MVCVGPDGPSPALPAAQLTDLRLILEDPASGRIATRLAWSWEDEAGPATYFEIYQGLRKDSLGGPVRLQDAALPMAAELRLPDTSLPATVYYGVRAVRIGATGQKSFGDSIAVDSLIATRSLSIQSPAPRSRLSGRELVAEVKTASDAGIVLRQSVYSEAGGAWSRVLDTCLPARACGTPILGGTLQRDILLLEGLAAGDSLESLYCVFGNETFEDVATGRMQTLSCSRFHRTGP